MLSSLLLDVGELLFSSVEPNLLGRVNDFDLSFLSPGGACDKSMTVLSEIFYRCMYEKYLLEHLMRVLVVCLTTIDKV